MSTITRFTRFTLAALTATTCVTALASSARADSPPAPEPSLPLAGLSDSGYVIGPVSTSSTASSIRLMWGTNAPKTSVTISSTKPTKQHGRWVFGGDAAVQGANVAGAGHRSFTATHLGAGQTYWYVLSAPTNLNQTPVEKMGKVTTFAPKGETDLAANPDSGFEITSVSTSSGGTSARVSWHTNAPSTQIKYSTTKPTKVGGKWVIGGTEPVSAGTVQGSGSRSHDLTHLASGTTYWFVLTAPTAQGQTPVQQIGSVTTLRRQVTAHFQSIHVIDDADKGIKGKGEITFYFRLVGAPTSDGYYRKLASDSYHSVDYQGKGAFVAVIANAGPKVTLAVQGAEDDQGIGDWCPYGTGGSWTGEFVQESNDCYDFSFADGTFDVPSTTTWFPFTIEVHRSPALRFTVSGFVSVTYVA